MTVLSDSMVSWFACREKKGAAPAVEEFDLPCDGGCSGQLPRENDFVWTSRSVCVCRSLMCCHCYTSSATDCRVTQEGAISLPKLQLAAFCTPGAQAELRIEDATPGLPDESSLPTEVLF